MCPKEILLHCVRRNRRFCVRIYLTIVFFTAVLCFSKVFSDVTNAFQLTKESISIEAKVNSSTFLKDYNNISVNIRNHHLQFCKNTVSSDKSWKIKNKLIVLVVPSSRPNFFRRDTIRKTWGSTESFNGWNVELIFVLGENLDDNLQNDINKESDNNGDIITFNFTDTYRALTYKTLLSFKWVIENCDRASLILKVDDDVFIDIFQLLHYISSNLKLRNTIVCHVNKLIVPQRKNVEDIWFVTKEEYSEDVYPDYCLGTAYLISMDIARALYDTSLNLAPEEIFWIEDAFITGILREHLIRKNISKPMLLNYSKGYNIVFIHEWKYWYRTAKRGEKLPWIFIQTWEEQQTEFENDFYSLWNRSLDSI